MDKFFKHNLIFLFVILSLFESYSTIDSPCGGWEPYKDEKCFKIFDQVGTQSFVDAEKTCHAHDYNSRLISIGTQEEQEFVSSFLFKQSKVVDNVWIGAKSSGASGHKFYWEDGSNLSYTNWAPGCPKTLADHCVQLHAESQLAGKWDDQPCQRKNLVVCQRRPSLSMSELQEILLKTEKTLQLEVQSVKVELKQENEHLKHDLGYAKQQIADLKQHLDDANKQITSLKQVGHSSQNSVPIGFVYVQLPNEKSPVEIWPLLTWSDVTSSYAGLFFRAEGGGASAFGQVQPANAPRLVGVKTADGSEFAESNCVDRLCSLSLKDGGATDWAYTGASSGTNRYIQFHTSAGEVRPKNMAMRIWKRSG